MPNPYALMPNAVGQNRPNIVYGLVSSNQPLPSSFSDPLYVIMPQWQSSIYFTINDWPACNGSALPTAGATVLLARDDARTLRCVWWSGTYSDSLTDFLTGPADKPTVTGSKDGNEALASLITALASLGIINDETT